MKIMFLGHSGFFVETQDLGLLCDPWSSYNPKYFNSWNTFPPNFQLDWNTIFEKTTHLYISHVHDDHLDEKLLRELLFINKNCQVILPKYRFDDLKIKLSDIGFLRFLVEEVSLKKTKIKTYTSETIDREREDSSIIIKDCEDESVFLNVNDSQLLFEHWNDIDKNFGNIDIFAGQFSGASWYPNCYEMKEDIKKELSKKHRLNSLKRFLTTARNSKKIIPIAGPAIFFDENLLHLNSTGKEYEMFPDSYEIEWKDERICRVNVGQIFDKISLKDTKIDFDKNDLINKNKFKQKITINKENLNKTLFLFESKVNEMLKKCSWIKKYIPINIYLIVDDNIIEINFKELKCKKIEKIIDENYYQVIMPNWVFIELIEKQETDWETAFLSMRCKFKRNPDKYNSWIISFFRNFSVEKLNRIQQQIKNEPADIETIKITIEGKEYSIPRFCPHMKYDLSVFSEIDEDKKIITCLGHGWQWSLEDGSPINNNICLGCKK